MRRTSVLLTAAALVVGAATLSAQTPNFSGKWTRIVDPKAPVVGGGGPDVLTIVQDSKTVTVTVLSIGHETVSVFNLDGTATKQTMTEGDGNPSEYVRYAKWDGSTLVVTGIRTHNGASATSTFSYSFDASGNLTVVFALPARGITNTYAFRKS